MSIALWFKPLGPQNTYTDIIDKGHGWGGSPYYAGYTFEYWVNTGNIGAAYGDGTAFYEQFTGGNYTDSQWHFMVANLGPGGVTVYMDGALVGTTPGGGPILQNNSDLYIGASANGIGGRYFNGLVQDVTLYDGPLSPSEVTALYNAVPEPCTWFAGMGTCLAMVGLFLWRARSVTRQPIKA